MTISVIIPVYKVEKYIRRCLQSVIDQESEDYQIECLIVDDCTPDDSMSIVNDMIDNYEGTSISFKIIRHEINKGLSEARNSGISESTGEFLFFIDSDDFILEKSFKCFVSYAMKYPYVDMIMGNSMNIEKNYLSNPPINNNDSHICLIEGGKIIMQNVLRRKISRTAWNKFVRRSIVIDNDLFFDVGLLYEDVTWTYRLFSCVSSVLIIPELTYIYENNPTSIIHTPNERANKMVWSFVFITDFLINHPPVIDGHRILFVEHRLFVCHWMLRTIDLVEHFGIEQQTCLKFKTIKRKLFWSSVCHVRPFMVIFFLTLFKPFCKLVNLKVFRANVYRFDHIVYKLS